MIPLNSDGDRVSAEGRLRVFETRDAGATWTGRTSGLPQDAYLTILRQAFGGDGGSRSACGSARPPATCSVLPTGGQLAGGGQGPRARRLGPGRLNTHERAAAAALCAGGTGEAPVVLLVFLVLVDLRVPAFVSDSSGPASVSSGSSGSAGSLGRTDA